MKKKNRCYRKDSSIVGILILLIFIISPVKFIEIRILAAVLIFILVLSYCYTCYKKNRKKQAYLNSGIHEVDRMSGVEFEQFLKAHFERLGYHAELTPASNDYGADLVLKKNGETIVVQAKRYQDKIGIKAIQEVAGAKGHYHSEKGMVVTNSFFTPNAVNLANSNSIELWDRNKLMEVMHKNNLKKLAQNIKKTENILDNCPWCEGKLQKRTGRSGDFIGCSNFPTCRYTRNH